MHNYFTFIPNEIQNKICLVISAFCKLNHNIYIYLYNVLENFWPKKPIDEAIGEPGKSRERIGAANQAN